MFQWLDANGRKTKRSFQEKGGTGTYLRVYHWAEYKDVPPLSSLAEIKTLKDEAGSLDMIVLISTAYLINYMRSTIQ